MAKNNPKLEYLKSFYEEIKAAADEALTKELPELREEDFFLFKKTGNRLVYEAEYFGRRKMLTSLAIVSLWGEQLEEYGIPKTDTATYIERLSQVMLSVCEEEFWALPAHVNFDRITEPATRLTIDLFASETAATLSEIVYRLKDKLDKSIVDTIKSEVCRRVLNPFAQSDFSYSWWETDRCNWSSVCAGSIGLASIYLNHPQKQQIAKRVKAALQCYLGGMEEDGACTEGLGYYNYGMSYYTAYAEAYAVDAEAYGVDAEAYSVDAERLGNEQENIKEYDFMRFDKLREIALFQQKCYFSGGISVSFSDGETDSSFLPGMTSYMKSIYPEMQVPDYSLARKFEEDNCYRFQSNERNISWLIKYGNILDTSDEEISGEGYTYELLPSAQWMICKDSNGNGFAAKGGNNDENHNHNDIGNFMGVYGKKVLLADLGAGEYTKEYFSSGRYDILCNRSMGHSVPLIDGKEQLAGKEYKADRFKWNEELRELVIEFTGAYPTGCIGKAERRFIVNDRPQFQGDDSFKMTIKDTFTGAKDNTSIIENLVTYYEPVIKNDTAVISVPSEDEGKNIQCVINFKSDKGELNPYVKVCEHSNHDGSKSDVYLLQAKTSVDASESCSCVMEIVFCKESSL